jgi:copper(I)-binding protein
MNHEQKFFASFFQKRRSVFCSFLKKRTKKLLLIILCVTSNGAIAAPVSVTCAWARASLPHQDATAAYMTLNSAAGDTLNGAESGAAGMVMLHQTTTTGGMSDMSDMDSLVLPAGKSVSFAPGGMHIMVISPRPARWKSRCRCCR